jgi:tetratricopeptide (TPR) repeat protein
MKANWLDLVLTAALVVAVLVSFLPTLDNDFVPFDDVTYILDNPRVKTGLALDSMVWAFSTAYGGNWHPITWLSHQLDVTLFGLAPMGHHAVSLLLHLVNTLLVFAVLLRMTGERWASFAAAVLFGLHPLRVESVAWISERKDVLSGTFWLLTMAAHLWFLRRPSWRRYCLALGLFSLGLAAKSMLVTLPCVLLLLDFWPLQRFRAASWRSLAIEKAPYFLIAIVFSGLAVIAQGRYNALNDLENVGLGLRLANATTSYVAYMWKTLFPTKLLYLYPFPHAIPLWKSLGAATLLLATTLFAWRTRKRWPFILVGWLWFLGALTPVIGIVQIGIQSMADRYTYIPSLGLSIALVWTAAALTPALPRRALWLSSAGLAAAILLTVTTRRQIPVWKNGETLFTHAIALMPEHAHARYNLAGVYATRGDHLAAVEQLLTCVTLEPGNNEAWALLGESLLQLGRYEEAVPAMLKALRAGESAPLLTNLAQAYAGSRMLDHALGALDQAMRHDQDNPFYYERMALLQIERGDPDTALLLFLRALTLVSDPKEAAMRRVHYAEAFRRYARVVEGAQPDNAAKALRAADNLESGKPS